MVIDNTHGPTPTEIRKSRGLSQRQAAANAEVSLPAVQRVEIGLGVSTTTLQKLARAYGIAGSDLHAAMERIRPLGASDREQA